MALLCLISLAGGYVIGKYVRPLEVWDPLQLRAYLNRPLDSTAPTDGFWLAGYYVDYDSSSLQVVRTRANHMDQVVVFGYGFQPDGTLTGNDQSLIKGLTGPAKRILLFANLTDNGFSQSTAHAILAQKEVQDRVVAAILAKTTELDAGGVQIDFENIPADDRAAFTAFLKRLKGELKPVNRTLSVALSAKTSDVTTGWGGADDYVAIGQIVDQVYIMAYDEHYAQGVPGPVASLSWTERVIRYTIGTMPAQKVMLGVPFYGYDWAADAGAGTKTNRAYGAESMPEHIAKYGGTIKWDPVAGENVATYKTPEGEDRIAWYPDQRSLDAKLKLAYQYNLKGVALWRLGFEPDSWWNDMAAFREKPTR
ncbi:MAG: glycosyl hydrolase family 18 protein [Mycobacterium leprae]